MACHRETQRSTRLGQEAEGNGNVVKRFYLVFSSGNEWARQGTAGLEVAR